MLRQILRKLLTSIRRHSFLHGIRRLRFRMAGVYIAKGTFIHPNTKIGKGTRINAVSHLQQCTIGAYCACGGRLIVRSFNHHTGYLNMHGVFQREILKSKVSVLGQNKGGVRIGNGVWIGDSVVVLPGVDIGNGAVIGAGSVVTKPIPDFAIAAGNPAKVIRMRFSDEVVALLRDVHWWNWSEQKLKENRQIFEVDLNTIPVEHLRDLLPSDESPSSGT